MKPQLNQIRSRIQVVINAIKALGDELTKVEIKTDQVADQYVPVINDAKKTLLTAIQKETSEPLSEIRVFDDVLALRDRANRLLNRLGDTSGSHSRVIHSFFGKHAKVLKLQLGFLSKEAKHLNELIERYTEKTSSLSECNVSISKIATAMKESHELTRKSEDAVNEFKILKSKEDELFKKIENLKNTESYRQYKVDKEELAKAKKDAESVLSEIDAAFSRISRPLSKYTYEVGLDKESNYLVQSVMEDPLKLVYDAKIEQLIEILKKIKESVQQGRIVVKNPDKDIENMAALMMHMQPYTDTYKQYHNRVQVLTEKTSFMDTEVDRLQREFERIRSDIVQKESFLNDYTQKLQHAKSTINSELNRIIEHIDKATGSTIKITI
jgi:predicted  nucleic acid-binding Zn-ribbon protein